MTARGSELALHFRPLHEVVRDIKSGALSSVDVTEYMLERIAEHDPDYSSYALVLKDEARAEARARDASRDAGETLGPLHGVPIAIKDLLFTQDIPTASGTVVMKNFVPGYNATVLEKLRSAGAVIIGKTQLTEGAFGSHHPNITPPKNPYNREFWPGVSSSGSGVSVAAGFAFGAIGSDTGGSIRFPSACCGLVGLKPTYGRVSRYGVWPLAESLDHIGPMTRTVEDAARIFVAIAGHDPADPTSLVDAVPDCRDEATDLSGVRIGVDWRYVNDGVEAPVVGAVRAAAEGFANAGAEIVDVEMPEAYRPLVEGWGITCGVECAEAHRELYPAHSAVYGPALTNLIELGLNVPRERYEELQGIRRRFGDELEASLLTVDAMLTPNMVRQPLRAALMEAGYDDSDHAPFINFTAPFDYSGHPTITLPAGLGDGLPLSIQLVARRLGEDRLVRLGRVHESQQGQMPNPNIG